MGFGGIMGTEAPSGLYPSSAASFGSSAESTVGSDTDVSISPTLQEVQHRLPESCTAREVIEAILSLHSEYGQGRALTALPIVEWPPEAEVRRQPVTAWYEEARSQLSLVDGKLSGKTAIVGLTLAERATGRGLVRVGLFALMVQDLSEGVGILSDLGRKRLATIPLASLVQKPEPYVIHAGGQTDDPKSRAKLSPDGRRAVCYDGPQISLWQVDGSRQLCGTRARARIVTARFSSDSAWLIALLDDGSLVRWQAESLTRQEVIHGPIAGARSGDLARDASCAAIRLDPTGFVVVDVGTRTRFDVSTNEPLMLFAVGPGGHLIAASTATTLEIFQRTGDSVAPRASIPVKGELASFDCGPTQVVAATQEGVRIVFDSETGQLSGLPLTGIEGLPLTGTERIALSADGSLLAAFGNSDIYLVSLASGIALAKLDAGRTSLRVSFSLNCRRLIASHDDGMARIWDVGVEPPGRPPAAAYDSDAIDTDRDLLSRNRDVDAFASLIAAVAVQPPLSIGIFGDWGSGKSWFMRQLKRRVAEIAADAKSSGAPQRELSFYKNIAQVEFNAWHYAETDVLTSLVEHIFKRLDMGDTAGVVEQKKTKALRALAEAEGQAGENAEEIRHREQELAAIETRRREREEQRDAREAELLRNAAEAQQDKQLLEGTKNVLRAVGWGSGAKAFADLIDEIDAASNELKRANPILTPLVFGDEEEMKQRQRRAWAFTFAGPVVGLLVGIIAWLVADRSVGLTALGSLGGLITGLIAGITGIVQMNTAWVRQSLDKLASEKNQIDAHVKDELKGIDKELDADRKKEADARQALDKLRDTQQRLVKDVTERQQELERATPERLLEDLIKARVSSGDYSRHLGLVAQARHDFETVSDLIQAVNDSLIEGGGLEESINLNRIVLYIDDLDRCEPSKVAAVLQAVHLLLAFPLFVVVVGVDSRWVGRALRERYPALLKGEDVKPRDYLEKIFQVPFWLDPMDNAKVASMLQGISGAGQTDSTGSLAASVPSSSPGDEPAEAPDAAAAPRPAPPIVTASLRKEVTDQIARSRELNPPGLGVEPHELKAMEKLADRLGRSPRSLKRFINVYRLMKVRAPDALDFSDRDRPSPDYLIVLLLLAEMIGRPDEAAALFDSISQTTDTEIDVPDGWPRAASLYKRWVDDVSRFAFDGRVHATGPDTAEVSIP